MIDAWNQLRTLYEELADLQAVVSVLWWDQQTCMPPKGAESRGKQIAALCAVIHEKVISSRFDDLLGELESSKESLTEDAKAYIRELRFQRDREVKLPASLVKELALAQSQGFDAWQVARRKKDFSLFAPALQRLVQLSRSKADCFTWKESSWDALVEDYERGMTAALTTKLLSPLRDALVPLIERILRAPAPDASFLAQRWEVAKQREFCLRVARDLGYDLEAGRLDVSAHPFTTGFGIHDVRITTRYREDSLTDAIGSTVHETGHALYDQGFLEEDERTPLACAPSYGVHESQSRFWEIYVGQSRAFWTHYLPILRQYFPGQLSDVTPEQIYRAVNTVQPGLIRVDADEVTYNLHVLIRFELEVPLLNGDLPLNDLPAEWNRRYKDYLGVTVPDDSAGCLQDVHWSQGSFSYFPSYSFGNMYAAMLTEKMEKDIPGFQDQIAQGRFQAPLEWLRQNIHHRGHRFGPVELIEKATGRPAGSAALLRHLTRKYSEIYNL